ncbi:MAG: hypothetical protein J1G05_05845 [Clostridiales bacterium]|nr:hypothetical protein [Clostridiales bacterium]
MKVQMRFQKILALVSLIIGALTILLAITFMSGDLAGIMYYVNEEIDEGVTAFGYLAQSFCNTMLTIGIIYLLCTVTLFITDTNKRRNYYITNYISTGLAAVSALVASVFGLIMVSILLGKFSGLNWEELTPIFEMMSDTETGTGAPMVYNNPTMFIISYVLLILPLLDVAALILNLVWKIKLMKGEKALLEQGFVKEVA